MTGLCVGRMWVGYPERGIEPWRDTGIKIEGPAVADVERALISGQSWEAPCPMMKYRRKRLSNPPAT